MDRDKSYLRHRSHVDNIAAVLPMIRKSFSCKYIELDFSKNLALKPKHEVRDAHFFVFSEYSLHCSIAEPGENKYECHLDDDANHDSVFKSDDAPTQYKNRFSFQSMMNLSNKYNIRIIRIYGAAGHGKG